MCEQLRNIYSCTDTLKLTCTSKSSGNYRGETIWLPFGEIPAHWWHGHGRFLPLLEVMAELKAKIIEKTGHRDIVVPDQEIMIYNRDKDILYQFDGAGTPGTVQGTWQPDTEPFNGQIRFFYKIAQEEKCNHWQEDWTERCSLK